MPFSIALAYQNLNPYIPEANYWIYPSVIHQQSAWLEILEDGLLWMKG